MARTAVSIAFHKDLIHFTSLSVSLFPSVKAAELC